MHVNEINEKDLKIFKEIGIEVINDNRDYWLIRTRGGKYYNEFINGNFVGIEWNEICDVDIINDEKKLRYTIEKSYRNNRKYKKKNSSEFARTVSYIKGRIQKFAHDIKKGDLVVITSEESKTLAFGVVDSDMYIYNPKKLEIYFNDKELQKPILKKRRNIIWIKEILRSQLDPSLVSLVYTQGAVSKIKEFDNILIERMLYPFYIKGDVGYFTFQVSKKENIPYKDMLNFLNTNDKIIQLINKKASEIRILDEDIILKVNVQSKGPTQIKGTMKIILIIGLVTVSICGGKMSYKDFTLETDGLRGVIETVYEVLSTSDEEQEKEIDKIAEEMEENKTKLELEVPELNDIIYNSKC